MKLLRRQGADGRIALRGRRSKVEGRRSKVAGGLGKEGNVCFALFGYVDFVNVWACSRFLCFPSG